MAKSGSFNTTGTTVNGLTRYLQFSWTEVSQNIANNTTTISYTLKGGGVDGSWFGTRYVKLTINGAVVSGLDGSSSAMIELDNGTVVASGTYTISHNGDGTGSFSVYCEAAIYKWAVNCSGSATFALDQIPRKSTLEVPNGTLGTKQTMTVSKKSPNFLHTITYNCSGMTGTVCTNSGDTNVSWIPPMDLALKSPQGTSVVVTFTIETFSGGTSVGTSSETAVYQIPASVTPYMASTLSDPTGYADYYGAYIQGQSKLSINIQAMGSYGAWVTSVSTIFDVKTYSGSPITSDVILQTGEVKASITATDSRNRTVTETPTINVLPYSYPKLTAVDAYRSNEDGTANKKGEYITVKFSSIVTSLNSKNGAWYKVQYKKSTEANYTVVTLDAYTGNFAVTNGTYTFPADEVSYDINVLVGDRFKTITYAVGGESVNHTISMLKKNGEVVGIAFGKLAEHEGVVDFGWTPKFSGGGDVVVEEGEYNGWTYRKWDSGVAECWKILEHSTTVATQWGSLYVGNATARQNYPFAFTSKPVEVVSLTSGGSMGFLYPEKDGHGVNGAYASARYNVASLSSIASAATYYFNFHVMGRWK